MLGFDQVQEQKQILSQKMIQSAAILQMDIQELESHIQELALENPLIDLDILNDKNNQPDHRVMLGTEKQDDFRQKLEWLNQMDEQNRSYNQQDYEEEEARVAWNFAIEENSFHDYVMSQLVISMQNEKERRCMEFLVASLDSKGYLKENPSELAEKLQVTVTELEHCLYLLQSAEPAGVGARTLEECLLLQLYRYAELNDVPMKQKQQAEIIINNHLELVSRRKYSKISALMGITEAAVIDCVTMIQTFNPIPGNSFSSRETLHYIRPDVVIVKFEGHFEIIINDRDVPRVSVHAYYLKLLKDSDSPDVRAYIQEKYQHIQWIQQCIKERNNTLKKVTQEILFIQQEFFNQPEGKRIPMGLQDVANKIGVHNATVSRAVRGKFLQCSRGIFPLNYFFVKSAVSTADKRFSPGDLKQKIKEFIMAEDRQKPLSDQKIANMLQASGIELSRRTVAKYRLEMGISDASGRKEC